jgi:Tol biopolymer transport system component
MLAYHQMFPKAAIWVTQVSGGNPLNLTADYEGFHFLPSWSPDGRQIAFWSSMEGGGYFVMPALGGLPRKLIQHADAHASRPRWSSDGKRLACVVYENGAYFLAVVSLETGESIRFRLPVRSGNGALDVAWSRDERYVAYVDARNYIAEVGQLVVLDVQQDTTHPITDGRTKPWSPDWSPDGRYLYYSSNRAGSMDLWRQRMRDGKPMGDPQSVTTGVGIRSFAFSNDGEKLAYSNVRFVSNVWRVPVLMDRPATWADAGQVTFDEASYIEFFDVSRDGERLAVTSDRAGNQDLWVLPAAGGTMQQLTTDPTMDCNPRWSPDGTEIAFYSYRSGNREIWVQPLSGGPARQITKGDVESLFPDWSPDGREIAFTSFRSGNPDIWVVSAQGGEPRQLTNHPAGDETPAWSPDGNWLAFVSYRSGTSQLWRVSNQGGEPEMLSDMDSAWPRWSPDGEWIYFTGWKGDNGNLWIVPAAGGPARQLTNFIGREGNLRDLATDGKYLYFAWEEALGDIWAVDVIYQ